MIIYHKSKVILKLVKKFDEKITIFYEKNAYFFSIKADYYTFLIISRKIWWFSNTVDNFW
jgi:hypothetical protein